MIAPPTEHLRLIRCARECPRCSAVWARAFAEIDWGRAEALSDKPGRTVWRVDLPLPAGHARVVVKVHEHQSPLDALRSILHGGRLRRHWRGAARLSRHGFAVARGRAILRGFERGRVRDVLVLEHIDGTPLIDLLATDTLGLAAEHAAADRLGELVSRLDRQHLHSKDLKPSNILVEPGDPPTLVIIDTDAVGRRPAHPLLPLALEPIGVGVLPRRALLARVIRSWAWHEWLRGAAAPATPRDRGRHERAIARQAWRDLDRLIRQHGDPTPLHSPLKHAAPVALAAAAG